MDPLLAAVIVVAAAAASVFLIRYIHGEERHHVLTRPKLVLITVWFLVSYGVTAFLVIPH